MEMEVQQEEWAKQKTTYRGDKSGLWGENNQIVHSLAVKVSVSAWLTNVGRRGRAVKRNKDMFGQWSCSSDGDRTGLKSRKWSKSVSLFNLFYRGGF